VPRIFDCSIMRGRWLLPVAALYVSASAVVPTGALAQRVVPEVPPVTRVPGPQLPLGGGTGGGAGLLPPMPTLRSAPSVAPAPSVVPAAPAAPVTVAPAVVRFRCQLEPGVEACKEPMAADGGGGEGECNCAVDVCREDPAGFRVCEKR
jgi:hypothetical protein